MTAQNEIKISFKPFTEQFLNQPDNNFISALWTLRILKSQFSKKYKSLSYKHDDFEDLQGILDFFNLELEYDGDLEETYDITGARAILSKIKSLITKNLLKELSAKSTGFKGAFKNNLKELQESLSLTDTETQILAFFVILEANPNLAVWTRDYIEDISHTELKTLLSIVLDIPEKEIYKSFSNESSLFRSGILRLDTHNAVNSIDSLVDLLDSFAFLMTEKERTADQLLAEFFAESTEALLTVDNYPYIENTQPLVNYLKNSKGEKGINILVYGQPGTGKTQWVKAVAQAANLNLYEVSSEDIQGDSISPKARMGIYQLAQHVLSNHQETAVLFDEVEDVFIPGEAPRYSRRAAHGKAWVNKILENNKVPSFWLTNSLAHLDPAYLRRFDMVIQIEVPPMSIRKDILSNLLKDINVRDEWIDRLSKESVIVPAVMERAIKVTSRIYNSKDDSKAIEKQIESLINSTLEAQGRPTINLKNFESGLKYSLDYLNTDADLNKLVAGLNNRQMGRMCLYGLPGTGKTAFGNYLSEKLEKPLVLKKASDLLSPYVGVAEMQIAAVFREAERDGAILQIDEADSFLQSRDNARHSWEITQVNEMLTQMESFDGIFIASTNLVNNLDQAAMRRFDLKLEFKALTPDQSWAMFENILLEENISLRNKKKFKDLLAALNVLTPGDFAAVKRKFKLGFADLQPESLFEALKEECSYKPSYNKPVAIGFHSSLDKKSA